MYKDLKKINKIIVIFIILFLNIISAIEMFALHPDDSMSLGLIYIIPLIIFINGVIGISLILVKSKYGLYFIINIVINTIVVFISFFCAIKYYKTTDIKPKKFYYNKTLYYLDFIRMDTMYIIWKPGEYSDIEGKYNKKENEKIELENGIYIKNDTIYNFPLENLKLKLNDRR
jgi:hypothetical protein